MLATSQQTNGSPIFPKMVLLQQARCKAIPLGDLAHGPVLLHLGEYRYKLYYEDRNGGSSYNLDKPLRMIYADGSKGGDNDTMEFADWENESEAREVHFWWPNGEEMDSNEESGLGDHMIHYPTNDSDFQVMFMNLSGSDFVPQDVAQGTGIAVLQKP